VLQESGEPIALPEHVSDAGAELCRAAAAVLDANWTGSSTVPSQFLYPHQWSWDSAFMALGYSCFNQERAETELRSLFRGQWANGLLPHIVFNDDAPYFPGPDFWETELSADAPSGARTSGIVQPPVHATAALRIYQRASDRPRAEAFLREMMPRLATWHEYLYRYRDRDGSGLVEIWHPWESGMDNTPLWDGALANIVLSDGDVPPYRRVDNTIAAPEQRPTDNEYDRYVYLIGLYRDCAYDPERIAAACPFAIRDVLFNSLLVRAGRDLAAIAEIVGVDPEPWSEQADRTAASIDRELWDGESESYLDFDVRAGRPIDVQVGGGFAPLYAAVPDDARVGQLLERLRRFLVPVGDGGVAVTSVAPDDPGFDPARYWRGPIWLVVNWIVRQGLASYGYSEEAEALRAACLQLVREGGFWEHYNPLTGRGQGTGGFAWSAGLVLDLVCDDVA
jgi:glycogen debranching enzyme